MCIKVFLCYFNVIFRNTVCIFYCKSGVEGYSEVHYLFYPGDGVVFGIMIGWTREPLQILLLLLSISITLMLILLQRNIFNGDWLFCATRINVAGYLMRNHCLKLCSHENLF